MHMVDDLIQTAEAITDRPLPQFTDEKEFVAWRQKRQAQFQQMLGIDRYLKQPRTDLNVKVTGTLQRDAYRIDKLSFESLPGLYVAANLYVPHQGEKPAPAILLLCGHAAKQKVRYQEHARRLAQLGFVVLVLDTIQLGEVHGIHHGTYHYGWFRWVSKGYTPVAVEVWNAIRGLDLLEELPEVDAERLGVTGNSGGGAMTWWTACADDRIKALAPSSGTGTIASHVREKTIDGHCDCMFPNNPYGWSLIEMSALVAPRPLLIASPAGDLLFSIESIRLVYERLQSFYEGLGFPEDVALMAFPGYHGYSPESRKTISQWFLRHLMNRETRLEDILDFDGYKEKEESLLVFEKGNPANDESTTVQDWFIPHAEPPNITSPEELAHARQTLITNLEAESFAAFPDPSPSPDVTIVQQSVNNRDQWFHKFSYLSEGDWRLNGRIQGHRSTCHSPSPTAIYLRAPGDGREKANIQTLDSLDESWLKASLDVRGTGVTAWGSELSWTIRRSLALTGRTITSMRIWDTLQGIRAVRSLPETDPKKIILAGSGEMAVVVLYAALLDGNISAVVLGDPPASLNAPGDRDGMDLPVEIINGLRHADLSTVAALLWPTQLVFVGERSGAYRYGERPDTYRYAEIIHRRLGKPGGTWRVQTMADWPGI